MDPTRNPLPDGPAPPPRHQSDEQPDQTYEEDIPSDDQPDEADGKTDKP